MSLYRELRFNPPSLEVSKTPREIKIDLVSVMCDNKYRWTAKKDSDGDFKISTNGFAYSNFQIPHRKDDIEWAMDAGDWTGAFNMINEGTSVVQSIQYR
jgi:hypothetical protein